MRDPLPAPLLLTKSTIPLANALSLRTLPLHTHEILPSFALYNILHIYIAPTISTQLFPQTYPSLPPTTKENWNIHLVSLLQSTFISTLALSVMYLDKERRRMGPVQRVWGYTGATGMVQGFSAGYFFWDLGVCMADVGVHGWGALTHAAAALTVSLLGFRPFCNYYGLSFILYELSTPFLNIHWFLDKTHLTGSTAQFLNGIILITTFAGSRLVWGTYQSNNTHNYTYLLAQTRR
ncbi:hypothetical protein JMJ35_000905 [Cladonia borealis]|uniref:TLC domain-containing protein n=1 Tax=Cladonia borealis TaxID=184061 RepID=A0AA39R7G7_9LECA|nr:hypothetical protein JMJ35_000905 [Cladonia borealis]